MATGGDNRARWVEQALSGLRTGTVDRVSVDEAISAGAKAPASAQTVPPPALQTPLAEPSAAPAEPAEPVRAGRISLLFFANIALWLAIYAPLQVLLSAVSGIVTVAAGVTVTRVRSVA